MKIFVYHDFLYINVLVYSCPYEYVTYVHTDHFSYLYSFDNKFTHTHTHTHIYIYIYRERERERESLFQVCIFSYCVPHLSYKGTSTCICVSEYMYN